jgi:FAD/FMN-containing dehydrogenase
LPPRVRQLSCDITREIFPPISEAIMKRRSFFRSSFAAAAAVALPKPHSLPSIYQPVPQVPPDVDAVTGDGQQVTLRGRDIADLAARLRGRLLLAGNPGYDEARRIFNPSFDRRPALIAQVTGAADVRTVVNFARENRGLLLAVKCGGHSLSGQSTCDQGVMIDLSPFRAVRVDPSARRVWVTGGSLLGLVDHEAMSHGLVVPLGTVSHTGVGGLVTGGGFGRTQRRFGLSIDNLISVDVVTADGEMRHASASENQDLFWGVRGGGGNFGVVTNFEFQAHPMQRQVIAGAAVFPVSRAREVIRLAADYGLEAPDELQVDWGIQYPPGGVEGSAVITVVYTGPPDRAERVLAPIRSLRPTTDGIQPIDYVMLQRSGDVTDPRAIASYVKSGFLQSVPDALVSAIAEGLRPHPGRVTSVAFGQTGGAIGRVAPNATALSQRDARGNLLAIAGWRHSGGDPAEHIAYLRQFWTSIEPFTYGFYVNDFENDRTAAQVQANYRENFERLVQVKNRYDPQNLFRLNANIQPTVARATPPPG